MTMLICWDTYKHGAMVFQVGFAEATTSANINTMAISGAEVVVDALLP